MEVANEFEHLCLPQRPPVVNSRWTEVPVLGAAWRPVLDQIELFRQARVIMAMVATDFFRHRLAPLQARPHCLALHRRRRRQSLGV